MNSVLSNNTPDSTRDGIAAIVLAAGLSSRMGCCKPLLTLDGTTALQRVIALFHNAGVHRVLVVLGHNAEKLQPLVECNGARPVINSQYKEGMYSSFLAACHTLTRDVQAAFVLPADIPLIRPATIQLLLSSFAATPTQILYPLFSGRRGHPPLIARSILDEAAQGAPGPLSSLLERHATEAGEMSVFDEAIHTDMDTPTDFRELVALALQRAIPSEAECEALLQFHSVPASVVAHSRAVAAVAISLARSLATHNVQLNLALVRAAALLHDLAKGEPNHAAVAARRLRAFGFDRVADVIAVHSDLSSFSDLDERAVVFLADKLVRNDQIVSIDERFASALERYHDIPEALAAAQMRKQTALLIAAAVEHIIGMPLTSLVNEEVHS